MTGYITEHQYHDSDSVIVAFSGDDSLRQLTRYLSDKIQDVYYGTMVALHVYRYETGGAMTPLLIERDTDDPATLPHMDGFDVYRFRLRHEQEIITRFSVAIQA